MYYFSVKKLLLFLPAVLLLLGFVFYSGSNVYGDEIEDIQKKIQEKEEEQKALREKTKQYEGVIHSHTKEIQSLQVRINSFNAEIQQIQSDVALKASEIEIKKLEIEKTTIEIQIKENLIEDRRQKVALLLRSLQHTSNKSFVEIILNYRSLSDFLDQVQAREQLQGKIKDVVLQLREDRVLLENKKEELNIEKEELVEQQEELDAQNYVLAQAKLEKQGLLNQTKSSQVEYKKLLQSTQEEAKKLNEEIFKLEEQLREALNPKTLPSGEFVWPSKGALITQGYGCLTSGFAARSYPSCKTGSGKAGGFHNGVDIAASMGTPILVVDGGSVIARSSSRYGYGTWVAIKHSNNLVSMYAHLSRISVAQGQHIGRGEKIGSMGSTGFSTGSHLHFVVYAPGTFKTVKSSRSGLIPVGATVDPYRYLSKISIGQRTPS